MTTKELAKRIIKQAEEDHRKDGERIAHLPATPGRATVERGLATVREGLDQIRKEAEL